MKRITSFAASVLLALVALIVLALVPATIVHDWRSAQGVARQVVASMGKVFAQLGADLVKMRSMVGAYAFQQTVALQQGFGIIGEWAFDSPRRVFTATIVHATPADIVVGRYFTYTSEGIVRPGGTGAKCGILMNPKEYANGGQGGVTLQPGLVLPTGTNAQFAYMGTIVIAAPAAVALDALAFYDNVTGVIGVGTAAGGQTQIANARFIRDVNAAAGLAVLEITQ